MATKSKSLPPLRVSYGSDPELMLLRRADNRIVSSIPVLKNDKHSPIDLGDDIKMYSDNVLVEASFSPSDTKEEFIKKLKMVFARTQKVLGDKYSLLPQASHMYPDAELAEPAAREKGCTPNFDAYAEAMNPPEPFNTNLRTGSFHLHIGNRNFKGKNDGKLLTFTSRHDAIKLLDIFVGCSSIIFDKDDTSFARRELYGKAGEFRPTPYGIEYRVLSNYALRSPELVDLVMDLVEYTVDHIRSGNEAKFLGSINAKLVQKAINTNNIEAAKEVLALADLPSALMKRVLKEYKPDFYRDWKL